MDIGTDNFYILLELSLDPPEEDAGVIREALQTRKQEWTRWQDNPQKRTAALKYLDLVPEIERVMLTPALRDEQARQAKKERSEMLRQFEAELRVLETKGHLLPREVTAIVVKYRLWGVDEAMVESRCRCPISETPPVPDGATESVGVLDRVTARQVQRALTVVEQKDLYTFLEEQPYSSIKKLQAAAEKKLKDSQQSTSRGARATAEQELAGLCLQIFKDFDQKQLYDRYLKVSRYPELGSLIDEENSRSRYIDSSVLLRLVNFCVEKYAVSVLEAEEYIRAYCTAYGIPVGDRSPLVSCPHCSARLSRESALCTSCGAPMQGKCPGCGNEFSEGVAVCAWCGFALGDMVKALRHLDDAQNALIENNWSTAQRNLEYARKYWPDHPQIEPLGKRTAALEDRYAQYVDSINDCIHLGQYYAAQELIAEAEGRRLKLPARTVEHVQKTLDDVEERISRLTLGDAEPTDKQVLELSELVTDSLEISRLMKKFPPEQPAELRAVLHGGVVTLTWSQSPSSGVMDYALVRKKGSFPLTAFDGDILYEGKSTSFEDSTAKPLVEYFYTVFARRGGTYSQKGAGAGSILIIPELEDVRIVPADQGAHITWKFSPDIREVVIWRKLGGERPTAPGEGFRIETARIDGFTDSKIKNDVEYWYYLVATYVVDGHKVYSSGVCESAVPHKFLAPIEQLIVVRSDGADDYVANWQTSQYTDVLLLSSPTKPEHQVGDIVAVQDLLQNYRRLDIEMRGGDSAAFHHPFGGGVYIFVVAVFGRFASVGQYFYLTNVHDVEDPTWDLVGEDLLINMKWPPGLQEVAVAYRFDRFPETPHEVGTTLLSATREQYDYDAAVMLREPENVTYYARVYAVFLTPDGNRVYSNGVDLLINNTVQQEIFYHLQFKKQVLGRRGTIAITLSSAESFVMPKAVFVGKIGRLPLGKTDGVSLFELERETRVNGEVVLEYQTGAMPSDLFIRMFLHDASLYERYRLLPLGDVKIT